MKIQCYCANCKKEIWKTPSDLKRSKTGNTFCSKSCACSYNNTHFRIKEKNPNWKGGDAIWQNYKKLAFDNYEHKCKICGFNIKSALQVHHIDNNRLNNNLNNLIILCANCHCQIHYGDLKIE